MAAGDKWPPNSCPIGIVLMRESHVDPMSSSCILDSISWKCAVQTGNFVGLLTMLGIFPLLMVYSRYLESNYEYPISSTVKEAHPTMWEYIGFPFAQTDPSDQLEAAGAQESERRLQAISAQLNQLVRAPDAETLHGLIEGLQQLERESVSGASGSGPSASLTPRQEVRRCCLLAMVYDQLDMHDWASRSAAHCVERIESADALTTSSEKLRVHLYRAHLALKRDQRRNAIGSYDRIIALLIAEGIAGTIFTDGDPLWLLGYAYLESAKAWAVLDEEEQSSRDARDAVGVLRQWVIDRHMMTQQQQLHLQDDQFVASFATILSNQQFVPTTDQDIDYIRLLVDYQRLLVFYLLWQYKLQRQTLTVPLAMSCMAALELAIRLGEHYDDREHQLQNYLLAVEVVLVFHERLEDARNWLADAQQYLTTIKTTKIGGPDAEASMPSLVWLALYENRVQWYIDTDSDYARLYGPVKSLAHQATSQDKLHLAGCYYALLAHAQFQEALVRPVADAQQQIATHIQLALYCFEITDRRHALYSQHTRRQAEIYKGYA